MDLPFVFRGSLLHHGLKLFEVGCILTWIILTDNGRDYVQWRYYVQWRN